MPYYIIKLQRNDQAWYLEWSSVTNSPVTYGMSLEDIKKHMAFRYGALMRLDLPRRMSIVEARGTNSLAMKLAGANRETKDISGGMIVRDAAGNPTGIFKDSAMAYIDRAIPDATFEQKLEAAQAATDYAASLGVTSVQDMSAGTDIGVYQGSEESRDAAYHQGTVWPWLLGFYCEATLRAYGPASDRVEELRALLDGFAEHLDRQGLEHVSEVFDGDPPHRPGGTIAQAWSCAELLRAYALLEDAAR